MRVVGVVDDFPVVAAVDVQMHAVLLRFARRAVEDFHREPQALGFALHPLLLLPHRAKRGLLDRCAIDSHRHGLVSRPERLAELAVQFDRLERHFLDQHGFRVRRPDHKLHLILGAPTAGRVRILHAHREREFAFFAGSAVEHSAG